MNSQLTPHEEINLKFTTDLGTRAKAVKPLEENTGKNLYNTEFGNGFLD